MIWHCGQYDFDTSTPIIMGILNVTPDSFSDGGAYLDPKAAVAHGLEMVRAGAAIVDVGGESTRPGATPVTPDEEWDRIGEVVVALVEAGICVSVDTRHAEVAVRALHAGASIVNDVSGFRDPAMREAVRRCGCGCVVMHMKGEPATMQDNPVYQDVVAEVRDYLRDAAAALEAAGIDRSRICVDPGPGFGKTPKQTIELMRNLHEIVHLGYPVMVAVSRKRFVGEAYHVEELHDRDVASAAEALLACELGASVVRTHNVEMTAAALKDLRPAVLLGLGSNVALVAEPGEETEAKIAQLNLAVGQLCSLPDTQIMDMSSFYESEPAYYEDQDAFVNAVVLLRSGLPPKELLGYLHSIENSLGRVRTIENGPRTLDIDILDYQMYVASDDELTLPPARDGARFRCEAPAGNSAWLGVGGRNPRGARARGRARREGEEDLAMKLTVLDEVTSTNEVVKNALREGKAEGLIVRARRQSSGYGRQGREWDSPEGGLYMSILLRPDVAGSGLATLSLVVGLSVQRALGQVAAPQFEDGIQVKWPNDVIYMPADCERADEYRKLCGISEACGGGVWASASTCSALRSIVPCRAATSPNTRPTSCRLESARSLRVAGPVHRGIAAREQAARREEVITDIQREVIARILVNYGRWRELGLHADVGQLRGLVLPHGSCRAHRGRCRHRYFGRHGHRQCRPARSPSSSAPPTKPSPSPPARPTSW